MRLSPKSTLAQQWTKGLTGDGEGDQFMVYRRTGQAIEPVSGPFAWILSMVSENGAQRQAALFNLQVTHRATVFDDAMAAVQQDDQVRSVAGGRIYHVKRIDPGLSAGGGTLYLSEVRGA